VSLGAAGSNVTIRFTTDNAGPWIMHWYDISTVVDKQSPPIAYLAENSMKLRDLFRILLSFSKDVENTPSEVFPTIN
jgi:hypothetical protein